MKTFLFSLAALALAFTAPAFAADEHYKATTEVKKDKDGDSKVVTKEEGTNAAGTTTKKETEKKVDVDSDGSKKVTTETKESVDPKGLMNKETAKTKDVVETDKNGHVSHDHKKVVNGKTVEETKTEHK